MSDQNKLFVTVLLSSIILLGWQYFYERPRLAKIQQVSHIADSSKKNDSEFNRSHQLYPKEEVLANTVDNRIKVDNGKLHGSISLIGARFDDIKLAEYRTSIKNNAKEVTLLAPSNTDDSYFAEFGWLAANPNIILPKSDTHWQTDKKTLEANQETHLYWDNGQGLRFVINIKLDNDYMFDITYGIENHANVAVTLSPYGLINRILPLGFKQFAVIHEGTIGAMNGMLAEETYDGLRSKITKEYKDNKEGDWLGITDKYWLSAIIPSRQSGFNAKATYTKHDNRERYQVDYVGAPLTIAPGEFKYVTDSFFVGAKKLKILDNYSSTRKIKLFDRAVDFGWFYFLTKPMFTALQFLHSMLGNFGLAILLITVIIKLVMFPLANKSYQSMSRMKRLQPELVKLRERFDNDKMRLNKEMLELYKREGVNPLSGCLPLIIQIPVFFSLYKVIYVTLEMRHAPFFGWIKDLSAPDPTTLFNLFGLIPWQPPQFLMIGIWPIIMGVTMYLQQKMNPEPTDPVQAQVMKFLPLLFVFMFNSFSAGLIIYWAWNNILSILQQWVINRSLDDRTA